MFTDELHRFLRELAKNNNRDWFTANKQRYEEHLLAPALELVRAMAPRLARLSKHLVADDSKVGGSMMRIYRDVRFGKDKRPYNEHVHFRFVHEKPGGLGYYLGIDINEVTLGAGVWRPDKGPIDKIRKAIAAGCATWQRAFNVKGWEPGGDTLARPPQGFDKDHPCITDIKRKDFVLFRKLKAGEAAQKGFADKIAAEYADTKPLIKFLADALKLPL
jgi:uncharacterized protein (TIGR02453 family)